MPSSRVIHSCSVPGSSVKKFTWSKRRGPIPLEAYFCGWLGRSEARPSTPLGEEEFAYWESVSEEILERIWSYLKASE